MKAKRKGKRIKHIKQNEFHFFNTDHFHDFFKVKIVKKATVDFGFPLTFIKPIRHNEFKLG